MKIFLIIPTLKQGGAERVISELTNEFCNYNNISVHLVLLAKSKDFYSISEKVIIHRLGFENKGKLQKKWAEIKTFKRLRSLFIKHKPITALSFMDKYNSFSILAAAWTGVPVYVSDRSNPLKPSSKLKIFLKKRTYKYALGIIAQTNFAEEILSRKIKNNNIKVISNPIKEVKLYPKIKRENIILNAGRLVSEKGQKYLIEAFANLKNREWKLVILGEGPLRNQLEKQIAELGLENSILMPGSVKNIDEWMARASVFALPSVSEGFPNALVEAMAAGLPCVSFDCHAGPRDIIINNENGILIKEKDVKALEVSLKKLIEDNFSRERLGKEALKIREYLSLSKIAKEYFEFIISKSNKNESSCSS